MMPNARTSTELQLVPPQTAGRPTEATEHPKWPLSWRMLETGMRMLDGVLVGLCGLAVHLTFAGVSGAGMSGPISAKLALSWLAAAILAPYCFAAAGAYIDPVPRSLGAIVSAVGRAIAGLALGFGLFALLTQNEAAVSAGYLQLWLAYSAAALAVARLGLVPIVRGSGCTAVLQETVAIVGAGEWGTRLARHIGEHSDGRYRVVGLFDDRLRRLPGVDGNLDDLVGLGTRAHIDLVVIALPWSAENRLKGIFRKLKALPATLALCPEGIGFGLLDRPMLHVARLPLLTVATRPIAGWDYIVKLLEDKLLGALILLAAAPVMAAIAALIKLDSPGPVLFAQTREGFGGRTIRIFKFRTMRVEVLDPSCQRQTTRDDARVTPLGRILRKTSLDELPQLFNVLRGEMSLVGPRPHCHGMRTEDRLSRDIAAEYAHRYRVKPGITGWAQVNGWRGATENSMQLIGRVRHDLYYNEHWSLWFDLKILALTVFRGFIGKNAF